MRQSLNELGVLKQTKSTALLATHQNSGAAACEGTSLLHLAECQIINIFCLNYLPLGYSIAHLAW
jgi:hypothetical protein